MGYKYYIDLRLGKPFDWNVAHDLSSMVPFFLAGGLNTSNVYEAIEKCR